MKGLGLCRAPLRFLFLLVFLLVQESCFCSVQYFGKIYPGVRGSEMNWIDRGGLFLFSNNSEFGFGFVSTPQDVTLFFLAVVHRGSSTVIWSANRASPVQNSDMFFFNESGDSFLQKGESLIWSTGTGNKGASAMELRDNGDLAVVKDDGSLLWQSFGHPTNTLVENQSFVEGMKLISDPDPHNVTYSLEFSTGNLLLYSDFENPQPYWSLQNDNRKTINSGGMVAMASISAGSWRFVDGNDNLLSQLIFSGQSDSNSTWVAVLGSDGFISFYALQNGASMAAATKIPDGQCSTPQPCDPYFICYGGNMCQCPSPLSSYDNCNPGITSRCAVRTELVDVGNDVLYYFALGVVPPTSTSSDLNRCKASCFSNCSCSAVFFQEKTGSCFIFDRLGSLQSPGNNTGFRAYVKIPINGNSSRATDQGRSSGKKQSPHAAVIIISVATALVIACMFYAGYRYIMKTQRPAVGSPVGEDGSDEDDFFKALSGMPVRLRYKELESATESFSMKLGQGGFGSVYRGVLKDGTQVAVKRLDSIGQGKREFRAEVSIIGSIHHLHLVRLKGYCTEGTHRLLAYEFMVNGSLDKWIFKRDAGGLVLDWKTRFEIAVGTAKGLAYLHEDCDAKIIHCDIKPENVLLDERYQAKVSDFGLAKLMTREQSHVFTNMRGTRGYLAPEWLVNYAISEKCDVYSYGVLLLEMIGGRKNYVATESLEKCHLSTFAFRMVETGRVREVAGVEVGEGVEEEMLERAVKVALWCVLEDTHARPSMGKVVQMLEGRCEVTNPPLSSRIGITSFLKPLSDGEGGGESSSTLLDFDSDRPRSLPAFSQSAVELSGPR